MSGAKSNGLDGYEWARAPPPPEGSVWARAGRVLYDSRDGSVLGRTSKRWGIALVFYGLFYAVLALMFSICMGGLFLTIRDERPSHTLASSLIGENPGVAARPYSGLGLNLSDTVAQIEEFLRPYENVSWFMKLRGCKADDNYGYPDTPCFYIKLNRIFDWEPRVLESMPADADEQLRQHVANLTAAERQQVWVSCWAEEPAQLQLTFPWGMGLPARHYPFRNQFGYLSPLVAVRVSPSAPSAAPSYIRCRAWADNIRYDRSLKEPSGYTRITYERLSG